METNVSPHQLRIYEFVALSGKWLTAKEVAQGSGVAYRTASQHLKRLVDIGIFDLAEVFPSYHYRLSPFAEKHNKAHLARLLAAKEVFAGAARAHG